MILQVLLIIVPQAVFTITQVNALKEVSAYVGDTITLPSGADPSWHLSKIEWSIFKNNTWIATYHKDKKTTDRFYTYAGRLSLCTESGNLTIHNLTTNDATEYSVDLISKEGQDSRSKIKLIVRQRPEKPTIETVASRSVKGRCWVVLHCSSTDEGVDFTWQVKPPNASVLSTSNCHSNPAVLFAKLDTARDQVEFTCTSSRNMANASSVIAPKCDDEKSPPLPQSRPPSRCRDYVAFLLGVIGGLLIMSLFLFRENIKAAWKYFRGECFPSTSSS